MHTSFDFLRLINAVLASIVFACMMYKGRLYWRRYTAHQKMIHASMTLYTLATAYGSVEAYGQNVPPAVRTLLYFIANLVALVAFFKYRGSAFSPPPKKRDSP